MRDEDLLDAMYAAWAKTTGAETCQWQPRDGGIVAVDQDGKETTIATGMGDAEAKFIAAVHGCLPELVRQVWDAYDESDRVDLSRDAREQRIAALELELLAIRKAIA
jgi:hypothetical protein